MTRIMTVMGARPQFIKAAPVCLALQEFGFSEHVIHTGQHYDKMMSDTFFTEMGIPEPFLNIGVGSGTHAEQTAAIMIKLDALFSEHRPDAVLVYGDTNSTLAGALTACKIGIPVLHVEAGLRSFNKAMPEEHNRVLTDHCSELLFCPTLTAIQNLKSENIQNNIHLVGDTMFDAVKLFTPIARKRSEIINRLDLGQKPFLLATLHRPYNTDNENKLAQILQSFSRVGCKIILPVHPRLSAKLRQHDLRLPANVQAIQPVGYFDMLTLQKDAAAILTDSGGLQKEAYFHGTPCVTLRPETEWIETVEAGWNRLAWDDVDEIVTAINGALCSSRSERPNLFGDGDAAQKIAHTLKTYL